MINNNKKTPPTTNIWYAAELTKWDKCTSKKNLKAIVEDTAIYYSYITYINSKYPNNYFILPIRKKNPNTTPYQLNTILVKLLK